MAEYKNIIRTLNSGEIYWVKCYIRTLAICRLMPWRDAYGYDYTLSYMWTTYE